MENSENVKKSWSRKDVTCSGAPAAKNLGKDVKIVVHKLRIPSKDRAPLGMQVNRMKRHMKKQSNAYKQNFEDDCRTSFK